MIATRNLVNAPLWYDQFEMVEPAVTTRLVTVMLPSLVAAGISFAWRGAPVLRGLDLALHTGTVTALTGPNGAGKTTLIRILAGALEPDAGHVWLRELDAVADRRAYLRRVGLAAAGDRGLYARLDVRANLELAAGLAFLTGSRRRRLVAAALERFELRPLARRRGDRLSLGQRQRLRLAIAFLYEPEVVLLDEPTSSLDADATRLLAGALRELTARGGSALWAAPAGIEPALPTDRALVLTGGRVAAAG
jgi:ABC-type multidrug transport system ATPase subunit